jgi:DNA mismatch endonuclease, patch repair protein
MASPRSKLTDAQRRRIMQAVRGRNTGLEMIVRRLVHSMGYRYRLHRRNLPGSPDLVFGPRRKVIFVHGCFWHFHQEPGCKIAHVPASRREYWWAKLSRNVARDSRQQHVLSAEGWGVLVLWECEIRAGDGRTLQEKIRKFLD